MQFNSYNFILYFLPIVCIAYYLFLKLNQHKLKNIVLLVLSFFFYACAGKEAFLLLLLSILCNYGFYKMILYYVKSENAVARKVVLFLGITANLLLLFYFKYYNFFIGTSNLVFHTKFSIKEIIQPMGISFIVFQQIAFLVDSSRNEVEECSLGEYALFISYFPHISSGPIILHKDLLPDLKKQKTVNWDNISVGIYMFVMGLGKKVLIADTFAKAVDWGYGNIEALNSTSALFVSIAYTIQIYFDFSGYSDMVIGISRILQLNLPINFNSPYKAKNILEFWDRWHMTLTGFFTNYLYIPLGGSRKGKFRTYINTLIVFLCSGLWHGASLTFVLWGALHGCFMIFTKHFIKLFNKIPRFMNQIVTLLFINFTWVLFRAGSFSTLKQMINALVKGGWGELNYNVCSPFEPLISEYLGLGRIPAWGGAMIALTGVGVIIFKGKNVQEKAETLSYSFKSCIGICIVAILCILSFSGVSSFIYSYF